MDGFEVMPAIDAAREGDIFITVTGDMHAIGGQHFGVMKSGAIIANSGHFNVEIDIPALEQMSVSRREARPFVEEFELGDGRRIFLLGEGRLINLAAAEGHPAAVMDMSFANQALAAEHMAKHSSDLEKKVHVLPPEIDQAIARLKLETMGIAIDELTAEQAKYLSSWDQGT
jgi:adenosylhomocysteinase